MRVLLIATNRNSRLNSRMNAQPLPIGLAYVAGHLDPARHQVRVLDLMFADDYLAEVGNVVDEFKPEAVGISLRNLSNHSYLDTQWALPITKAVIDAIRARSNAPIICGGPAFSILPKECFEFLGPDLGVAGDAGETFAEVCNRIEVGEPAVYDLPGLVYANDGGVTLNEGLCVSAFASRPRLEDLEMDKYRNAGFGIGVLTKLGSFSYPTPSSTASMTEADYRVIRPVDEVVAEVKELWERFQLRKVFFVDNGFNLPLDHAKSLCSALIEADLGVRWNTCLASFNCDAELIRLMKDAGCALVLMGNRGGDPHDGAGSLEERMEAQLEVPRLCEEGGLHYTVARTFGEPGETRETVERKLDFLRRVNPALANLRIGVSVMPGTDVAALALEEGLISDESELIEPTFYIAGEVRDWIVDYLKEEAAKHPRWNLW
jgi:radical SAM superfamily enzyme YgiQ (UPF0313 family)